MSFENRRFKFGRTFEWFCAAVILVLLTGSGSAPVVVPTDALFISSDCEEFRGLSRTIEATVRPPYLVMDGRRMIPDYEELVAKNFSYLAVGSQAMIPEVS